ncbi:hypothetical protein [Histophilus somni]|nr:hypothetical protein [Histophilus somni]
MKLCRCPVCHSDIHLTNQEEKKQFDALLKIAECTVLEFVNETKLESFV